MALPLFYLMPPSSMLSAHLTNRPNHLDLSQGPPDIPAAFVSGPFFSLDPPCHKWKDDCPTQSTLTHAY